MKLIISKTQKVEQQYLSYQIRAFKYIKVTVSEREQHLNFRRDHCQESAET